jgi:hypothetical protein
MQEGGELPAPRTGDYEYSEKFIKEVEFKKAQLGTLKVWFNNREGKMYYVAEREPEP